MGKCGLIDKFCGPGTCMRKNWLLLYTISGVFIGVGIGLLCNYFWATTAVQRYYWGFPGEVLMMNMLKCVIIPIIVFSITTGVASMAETGGKLIGWAVAYYLTTTILAIINGIIFAVIIKPGKRNTNIKNDVITINTVTAKKTVVDGLLDIIRNCFPPNIIEATIDQTSTFRNYPSSCVADSQGTYWTDATFTTSCAASGVGKTVGGSQNTLGLITFCCIFGYYLGKNARKHRERGGAESDNNAAKVLSLFNGMNDAIMKMIDLVMLYHPIGLCFLISKKIMDMGENMAATWTALGFFILNSIICLLLHAFIILPLIYWLVTKKNPFKYMYGMAQALITAFACASSAATMPITIRNCENNNGIDTRVTRFMLPLGATINMDGTALYEAIACLFIANLNNMPMNFGHIVTIAVTSTAASIGAAAVPSAGLITLLIVLGAVGLLHLSSDIALIYTVDWFLDRIRTATNVWGDAVGCACVAHVCSDDLEETKNEFTHTVEQDTV